MDYINMVNSQLSTPPLNNNESKDYFSQKPKLLLNTIDCSSSTGSNDRSTTINSTSQFISPIEEEPIKPNEYSYCFLVVDDNLINLKILSKLLKKIYPNATVHVLQDSTNVLEVIKYKRFDLIFLDIEMPSLPGTELARLIRLDENFVNLGLIAVTTKTLVNDLIIYEQLGIDFTFSKPLNSSYNYIMNKINNVLNYRKSL